MIIKDNGINELINMGCIIIDNQTDNRKWCVDCKWKPTWDKKIQCNKNFVWEKNLKINCIAFESNSIESESVKNFWE